VKKRKRTRKKEGFTVPLMYAWLKYLQNYIFSYSLPHEARREGEGAIHVKAASLPKYSSIQQYYSPLLQKYSID
jgi:hypothetical protein